MGASLECGMDAIEFYSGRGPCRWLSNFHRHAMEIDGWLWSTVEHFYQAAKTLDKEEKEGIWEAPTPSEAKRRGGIATLRPDWEQFKEEVMLTALRAKFSDPDLRLKLLDTGDSRLEEASPTDMYWGNKGKNRLGILLMQVREELGEPA